MRIFYFYRMDRMNQLLKFLEESPEDSFLKHALALEYVKAGNVKEAETMFQSNLEHEPAYVATYYHLGKLLERCGRLNEAVNIYEAGMEQAKKAGDMHAFAELQAAQEDLTD